MVEPPERISNEEVEALLQSGAKEIAVRPYDFAAQRINRTQLPLLEEVSKIFAARAGTALTSLLGRDAVTINSGGEKIFAEEVERAIAAHPDISDVIVAGRPSERWGSEVVAIVALRPGATATDEELLVEAGRHVARYKLPKAIVRRPAIARSPSGKADYRWAKDQVTT